MDFYDNAQSGGGNYYVLNKFSIFRYKKIIHFIYSYLYMPLLKNVTDYNKNRLLIILYN